LTKTKLKKGEISMIGWVATILIAVIWGYFAELRNGQVGLFIGRLVFMIGFYYIMSLIMGW